LCSRCGTFVNGERVSNAALQPGDELHVGPISVEVRFLEAPDESAAAGAEADQGGLALPSPLQLSGAERQYELTMLPAVIGRRHACQILLDTPDVSLAHALLFTIEGCPAVFDLGSRSGTVLNGSRVTLAWLRDGDRICIGGEELTLSWTGPQAPPAEATAARNARAVDPVQNVNDAMRCESVSFAESGSAGAAARKEVKGPQARPRKRPAARVGREARSEALEAEWARLAAESQRLERQAAELRAAAAELEQDRAWFEAQRKQFQRERAEFVARQAEAERRFADHEKVLRELREREAALAEAEQEIVKRQAELAKREAANAEAVRRIEQFRETLGDAQRMFASAAMTSGRRAAKARRGAAPTSPAGASDAEPGAEGGSLPAPLVDEPLFAGLDPGSPEQWPQELQERLRLLGRESGKSDAEMISQVLAEHRARHIDDRKSPGN
jgi:hypothetical protein